jgi:hypothetical protein
LLPVGLENSSFSKYSLILARRSKSSAWSVFSFTTIGFSASEKSSMRPSLVSLVSMASPFSSSSPPSRISRTGLFCSSCSMRSSNAIRGNWRISMDWIMRGVSSCR